MQSLGVLLFVIVCGYLPFAAGNNLVHTREDVVRGSFRVPYYMSTGGLIFALCS